MDSDARARRREEVDRAYELQIKASAMGAARYTLLGLGLVTLGHYSWPLFRRQTLPFKTFLVSAFSMFGLVVSADTALLSHEADRRKADAALRKRARIELTRRGMVPTESEISRWKAEREASLEKPS